MRALTMEELEFVSGGSVNGQWGGGSIPWEMLDDDAAGDIVRDLIIIQGRRQAYGGGGGGSFSETIYLDRDYGPYTQAGNLGSAPPTPPLFNFSNNQIDCIWDELNQRDTLIAMGISGISSAVRYGAQTTGSLGGNPVLGYGIAFGGGAAFGLGAAVGGAIVTCSMFGNEPLVS